jgi:hypothetical protein
VADFLQGRTWFVRLEVLRVSDRWRNRRAREIVAIAGVLHVTKIRKEKRHRLVVNLSIDLDKVGTSCRQITPYTSPLFHMVLSVTYTRMMF